MQNEFPDPTYFGRNRHWKLSDLLEYEARLAGQPPPEPLDAAAERYLTAGQIRERYNVSDMWIWRRLTKRNAMQEGAA